MLTWRNCSLLISEPNLPTDNRNKAIRDKSGVKQSIRIMIIKSGENSLYDNPPMGTKQELWIFWSPKGNSTRIMIILF